MTTEDQELATTATSLDTGRGIARTPLGAHGVHKKDTTFARWVNLSVATVERITQQPTGSAQSTESNKKGRLTYDVMIGTLNILQANLHRSSGVQDALYNDPDIWDFDVILVQEPHYWEIAGNLQITGAGPNFEVIKPKTLQRENQTQRVRSCIWINRNNEYAQISMNSNDITAIVMKHGTRSILLVSVYIPSIGNGEETDEQELHIRL